MKQKVLAMILSMAMVFTLLPATPLQAEENLATGGVDVAAAGDLTLPNTPVSDGNLAKSATASADHHNTPVTNVNDGNLASGDPSTSWNTWGAPEGEYPTKVTLTWGTAQSIASMRVMWWSDGSGVTWPSVAYLEYLDGGDWKQLPNVGVGHGGTNGSGDKIWNIVNFSSPVSTTALRMRISRAVTGTTGVGISEWEVYGSRIKEELAKAEIVGRTKIQLGKTETYTGSTIPVSMSDSASYQWSVAPADVAAIQGDANKKAVTVKGLKFGKATVKLAATYEGVTKEAEFDIRVREDKVESIDIYQTSTAAGTAPILPNRVVANGVEFDDPTPSQKSWTKPDFDFAEEFNSSLIPVTWEKVDPANYAKGKEGTTFRVKGTATYNGKKHDAYAMIKVNDPVTTAESNSSVTFENVQMKDNFWAPKQEVNAKTSLEVAIDKIEQPSGGEPNFDNAIKKLNGDLDYGEYSGYVFQDSDIYKSIESISYALSATQNDNSDEMKEKRKYLQDKLNTWIEKIEKVQYADGYIYTMFTLRGSGAGGGGGTHRWIDLSGHEMYDAGHFLEGAVAYTRYREGIGDPDYRLYVVGKRLADHIVNTFGPAGTRHEVPGHEEIEIGMVKFGKLAEELEGQGAGQDYYNTVKTLIDRRGEDSGNRESGYYGSTYSQDATPFKEETEAVGHAVRANYFYTGVTDIATLLPEGNADREAYLESLDVIYDSVTEAKTYITGAIGGPGGDSEGYASAYNLAPEDSYAEICAAIAAANWNQRMNLLHEDSKYVDMVERNLYNSILVGTNLDGNLFYYSTKLKAENGNIRHDWFDCACCPPNLMRTIAAVSGYMYAVHNDTVFVNMYSGSEGKVNVAGTQVGLKQETEYPWKGTVKMTVNPAASKEFTMKIRIPGWVNEQENKNVTIKVNNTPVTAKAAKGYVAITRTWNAGDVIDIDMPMEIRMTESHPLVKATQGQIALQRGPIVYCMELAGNKQLNTNISNFNPMNFVIPRDAELTATYNENLLNGVTEITGDVKYNNNGELIDAKLQAIPYYAWNNRGDDATFTVGQAKNNSSKMLIWTTAADAEEEDPGDVSPDDAKPSIPTVSVPQLRSYATPSVNFVGWNEGAGNFADDNMGSIWNGHSDGDLATRPQWMMYDFGDKKVTLTGSTIRFKDDGNVVAPTGITIEYLKSGSADNGTWEPVTPKGTWSYEDIGSTDASKEGKFEFEAVTTSAIRITMTHAVVNNTKMPVAVFDWKVIGDIAATAAEKEATIKDIEKVEEVLSSSFKEDDYTAASWSALQDAIAAAKTIAAKENAGLVEVKEAQQAVSDAYAKLDKRADTATTQKLQTVIDTYKDKEAEYSAASWAEFDKALKTAEAALESGGGKDEINAARKALEDAAANLDVKADAASVQTLKDAVAPYTGKESEYTAASWKKFKPAFDAASALATAAAPGQKAVEEAQGNLEDVIPKLDKKASATAVSELKTAIASYNETDYTPESWKMFKYTLDEVKAVSESQDPGEKMINAAKTSLDTAKLNLVKAASNESSNKLQEAIQAADSYKEADYTPESWAAYTQALKAVKDMAASGTADEATVAELQKMLEEAEAKLVKKNDNPPPAKVDKTALNASITAAKAKKQADYTPASWNKLKTALTAAQSVAGNAKATQAQVDTAKNNLDAAIKALVKVKVTKKKLTLGVKESYSIKSSNCTYTTSDKKKATVSKSGQIKALKTGTVTVKAINKNGNITQYTVTVKKAPDKKAKVSVNKKKVTLSVKNKKKKTFTIKPKLTSKNYGCATFKYTIDKKGKKVVKVDKNGKVTAKKKGKATITVKTYNGKGKSAKVTITVK